ncbi:MAG: tetratricopeptide repeat protein [Panacagrimonas sp.]
MMTRPRPPPAAAVGGGNAALRKGSSPSRKNYPDGAPYTIAATNNLAQIHRNHGRYAAAETLFREWAAFLERSQGDLSYGVHTYGGLGRLVLACDAPAEAIALHERSLANCTTLPVEEVGGRLPELRARPRSDAAGAEPCRRGSGGDRGSGDGTVRTGSARGRSAATMAGFGLTMGLASPAARQLVWPSVCTSSSTMPRLGLHHRAVRPASPARSCAERPRPSSSGRSRAVAA